MNINQQDNKALKENVSQGSVTAGSNSTKETYHAPQLTIHGKLERITLQQVDSLGPVATATLGEG